MAPGLRIRLRQGDSMLYWPVEGVVFDDVPTLLADTGTFETGTVLRTWNEGFSYTVADPGATDHHLTTAGGVKLYVLPDADGARPASGLTETDIQKLIDDAPALASTAWGYTALAFTPTETVTISTGLLLDTDEITISGMTAEWGGAAGGDLLTMRNTPRSAVSNAVLLGASVNTPQCLLYLRADDLASSNNENIVIERVIINRVSTTDTTTGGSADATPDHESQYCVLIGGAFDGGNDEFTFRNCQFHNATIANAYIQNAQSIWGLWDSCLFNDAPIGLLTGANTTVRDCHFNRNTTADISAVRDIDVWVDRAHSENSEVFGLSTQGASLYFRGGKMGRNSATPGTFFDVQNGGSLVLDGVQALNSGGTGDTVRWRPGTSGGARQVISVRNSEVAGGNVRSTWDIHTAGLGGVIVPEIDIDHDGFRWRTRQPYIDVERDAPSIADNTSALVTVDAICTLGNFYNVSAGVDLQGMHTTIAQSSATVMRARVANLTGATIDLVSTRWRFADLAEHVRGRASAVIDVPLTSNLSAFSTTISLPDARMGDFVVWSAAAAFINMQVSAYVVADGVVGLEFLNVTGGNSDPAATTFNVARLFEGMNLHGSAYYAGSTISDGDQTTINVAVLGAQLGGHAFFAYSGDMTGLFVSCHVSAADTVTVVVSNQSGAAVVMPAGTMRAMVAF